MINSCVNGINNLTAGLRNFGNGILSRIGLGNLSISALNTVSLPRLATGTNYVPQDMVAQLHTGESVVPKKYNGEWNEDISNNLDVIVELLQGISRGSLTVSINSKDVGKAAVNYINSQNRILGASMF